MFKLFRALFNLFDVLVQIFIKHTEKYYKIFTAIYFLYALTLIRIDSILNITFFAQYYKRFGYILTLWALVIIYKTSKKSFYILVLFAISLLLYSYTNFFLPSLRKGMPRLDYLLHDKISANFSFDVAKSYVKIIFVNFTIFFAFFSFGTKKSIQKSGTILFNYLLIAMLINSIVAIWQGLVNLKFLAQGSGTALGAKRAAALFEDSGASTTIFAAFASATFLYFLFSLEKKKKSIVPMLLLIIVSIGAYFTKGRIVFISFFASAILFSFLFIIRQVFVRRKYIIATFSVLIIAAPFFLIDFLNNPRLLHMKHRLIQMWQSPNFDIEKLFLSIDPVRYSHQKTMWLAYLDNSILGSGLGSFYANYHHYYPLLKLKKYFVSDPPASMFLMLLSELGITGILIIFSFLSIIALQIYKIFFSKENSTKLNIFALGILVSMIISFLIGIHIIFTSFSVLLLASFSYFLTCTKPTNMKRLKYFISNLFALATMALLINSAYSYYTAPRMPEFYWKKRGKAQKAIGLIVKGNFKHKGGYWASTKIDYLYKGQDIQISSEVISRYYPFELNITIKSPQEVKIHEQVIRLTKKAALEQKQLNVNFPDDIKNQCKVFSSTNYCSLVFKTNPKVVQGRNNIAIYILNNSL